DKQFHHALSGRGEGGAPQAGLAFVGGGVGGKLRLQTEWLHVCCPHASRHIQLLEGSASGFVFGLFGDRFGGRARFIAAVSLVARRTARQQTKQRKAGNDNLSH